MEVLLGKSSVNGPFSIAMLVYQRVKQTRKHPPVITIHGWYKIL
jgi:hypothetical protein